VAGSENHLYSAYAWLKLFSWTRKEWHKHLSQTDMQAMSSSVVLSMLSILPYDVRQVGADLQGPPKLSNNSGLTGRGSKAGAARMVQSR
jgi:hypothetical protein